MATREQIENQIEEIKKRTFLDPTYDSVFKEIFSVDQTLIHFLNSILHLQNGEKIVAIEKRLKSSVKLTSKIGSEQVRYDLHARLNSGKYIDLEMQRAWHSYFLDRVVLYAAQLAINSKIDFDAAREKEFNEELKKHPDKEITIKLKHDSHLYEMPRAYSIWICNFGVSFCNNYREELALYRQSDIGNANASAVYDKNKYIVIDLTRFHETVLDTPEKEWLALFANAANATEEPESNESVILDAYARLKTTNTPAELIEKVAEDMVTKAEIMTRLAEAGLNSLQKVALRMLEKNEPISKICEYSGLTEADILALKK